MKCALKLLFLALFTSLSSQTFPNMQRVSDNKEPTEFDLDWDEKGDLCYKFEGNVYNDVSQVQTYRTVGKDGSIKIRVVLRMIQTDGKWAQDVFESESFKDFDPWWVQKLIKKLNEEFKQRSWVNEMDDEYSLTAFKAVELLGPVPESIMWNFLSQRYEFISDNNRRPFKAYKLGENEVTLYPGGPKRLEIAEFGKLKSYLKKINLNLSRLKLHQNRSEEADPSTKRLFIIWDSVKSDFECYLSLDGKWLESRGIYHIDITSKTNGYEIALYFISPGEDLKYEVRDLGIGLSELTEFSTLNG
jgi:hypothetical protein